MPTISPRLIRPARCKALVKERLSKGTFLGLATRPLFTFGKGFSSFGLEGEENFLSFLSCFSFFFSGFESEERVFVGDKLEVEG